MRYSDYDNSVTTIEDLERYKKYFQEDIAKKEKELSDFIDRGYKRIKWIKECEKNKNYSVVGGTMKDGKCKSILFIIRYPDGTQREERYNFTKIAEMRNKLQELKTKHDGIDWSLFHEEI